MINKYSLTGIYKKKMYLFLDHSGVMCPTMNHAYTFHTTPVRIIEKIIDMFPDIRIVMSSDWSNKFTLREIEVIYKKSGMKHTPVSHTKILACYSLDYDHIVKNRYTEIMTYLESHGSTSVPYVVIDDLDLSAYISSNNFLHVNPKYHNFLDDSLYETLVNKCSSQIKKP